MLTSASRAAKKRRIGVPPREGISLGGVPTRPLHGHKLATVARQLHDRRCCAGRSRPYWWSTRPDTAPLASRTKVICASTTLAKKSVLLSAHSCTAALLVLDLIESAPFCSVTSSSRPGASS